MRGKETDLWVQCQAWLANLSCVMVKSCCAPGCRNCCTSDSSLKFHRALWIAAVRQEQWKPTKHSVLCSAHFASGSKSNSPLSPDYVPTLFSHTSTDERRRAEQNLASYTRRMASRKRRSETAVHMPSLKARRTKEEPETEPPNHQRTRKEQGQNWYCNNDWCDVDQHPSWYTVQRFSWEKPVPTKRRECWIKGSCFSSKKSAALVKNA